MATLALARRLVSAMAMVLSAAVFCAASLLAGIMVGLAWPSANALQEQPANGLYVGSGTAPAGQAACRDGIYALAGYKQAGPFDWRYNPAGAPPDVRDTALATVIRATEVVASGTNRCRLPASVRAGSRYQGLTQLVPQVSRDGQCGTDDHRSVTGWGLLDPQYLAITCSFRDAAGKVGSSDTLINSSYQWFTGTGAGCQRSFDLMSVMVHERGHTFGLDHVLVGGQETEVMAPKVIPCDRSKRALGYGDYLAMVKLYGVR
ncbi:MAG: matrixin family metalloprotease [Actinobacteria bacterium]|nr:matrixin family metalloprotease [Actinomycetota bacterium]